MHTQNEDAALIAHFTPIANELQENEEVILAELMAGEGNPADLGGYYLTDAVKTDVIMRPSKTLLRILSGS